jgi:hypothetical protein
MEVVDRGQRSSVWENVLVGDDEKRLHAKVKTGAMMLIIGRKGGFGWVGSMEGI